MTGSVTMIKSPVVGVCSRAERDLGLMESILICDDDEDEGDP